MSVLKELKFYLLGLLFIITGILTFTYIEYVNQRVGIGASVLYYIIGIGFIFILFGSLLMILFVKSDLKKKSSK